jgi:hypothetical protein
LYLEGGADAQVVLDRHREAGYQVEYPQDMLRVVFSLNDHWSGYQWDLRSIARELGAAGFVGIRRCDLGQSSDPVLQGLESRSGAADNMLLLTVEAQRPA